MLGDDLELVFDDKNICEGMDKWVFNENVTLVFSEMLERSIPSYDRMRELVTDIGSDYVLCNGLVGLPVLDLGCSTGEQIDRFLGVLPNRIVGCDVSDSMLEHSIGKYQDNERVEILKVDISKQPLPVKECCLITSILTIQFTPIEYRQNTIRHIYESLTEHGVFIFVEKIIGENYNFSKTYEKLHHTHKQNKGYSLQEIRDKKLKLEGVLVPVTNTFNIELLKQAGFSKIDIFWKDLNFIGYIAIK